MVGVMAPERQRAFPDVPTFREQGLANLEVETWYGVLAPAGTPDDILNTLNQHIVQIMQSTEMKQRLNDDGLVPVGNTRQQFAVHIKAELAKWAEVIKRLGTRID